MHWVIWLAIFFIAIYLVFKIVKTIIKTLMVITSLTVIILIIASIVLVSDISDFNNNFRYSSKMILLKEGDKMLSGVIVNGEANPVPNADLEKYSQLLSQNKYEDVLGGNYKLMVLKMECVDDMKFDEINVNETVIRKSEVPVILRSNAPIKFNVFGEIVKLISNDQLFILQQYKKGNLIVYPETPVFKLVKAIPYAFIKSVVMRGVEEVRSGLNQSSVR